MSGQDKYSSGFTGQHDVPGYDYTAPNPLEGMNSIDPSAVNPFLQLQTGKGGPDYLQYDIRGRSWTEKTFFNCGTVYLLGIGFGGAFGFFEGLRTSPSSKFNIRLNTVLNKMDRRGSRAGNALGSVAMLYSLTEGIFDYMEVEKYFGGSEHVNPFLASVTTGLLYKSTQGPRTMAVAALMGGTLCLGVTAVRNVLPRPLNNPLGVLFF